MNGKICAGNQRCAYGLFLSALAVLLLTVVLIPVKGLGEEKSFYVVTTELPSIARVQLAPPKIGHPKMGWSLSRLLESRRALGVAEAQTFAERHMMVMKGGLVQVEISAPPGAMETLRKTIEELGGEYQGHYRTLLQALVPIEALELLAQREDVWSVRNPVRAMPTEAISAGAYTSEGVAASRAYAFHRAGFTGSGVKIGVIDVDFEGYTSLLGSDLPSSVIARDYTGTGMETGVVHGTACAEIIYDMAPKAEMTLSKVSSTNEIGQAVTDLIADGVDIISMSISVLAGPGDGTGLVNDIVANARAEGIFIAKSAGNYAETHWDGFFLDDGDFFHLWAPDQDVNYFGPGISGQAYVFPVGYPIVIYLRWDDWGNVNQDYDLILVRWTGFQWAYVWDSSDIQDGSAGQTPEERIGILAPYQAPYGVMVEKWDATRDVHLCLLAPNMGGLDERVEARSLGGQPADSADVMTVGAVDVRAPYLLETYSSQGPTYGPGGTRTGGITKPDIVAYANVSTVSYGAKAFAGTSPATPHVAGAAALVKQAFPDYGPDDLKNFLESSAVDMGPTGKDNQFGAGRLFLGRRGKALPALLPLLLYEEGE